MKQQPFFSASRQAKKIKEGINAITEPDMCAKETAAVDLERMVVVRRQALAKPVRQKKN